MSQTKTCGRTDENTHGRVDIRTGKAVTICIPFEEQNKLLRLYLRFVAQKCRLIFFAYVLSIVFFDRDFLIKLSSELYKDNLSPADNTMVYSLMARNDTLQFN